VAMKADIPAFGEVNIIVYFVLKVVDLILLYTDFFYNYNISAICNTLSILVISNTLQLMTIIIL